MPKIPIDFSYGDYEDAAPAVENRRVLNCYPETTQGRNTKTVVRAIEGFQFPSTVSGLFQCSVSANGRNYCVIREPSGQDKLYKYSATPTSTSLIYLADLGSGGSPNLATLNAATNGKNLVFVDSSVNLGNDYSYDLVTTAVTKLSTLPNYPTVVRDVVYKDGYYLFITYSKLFHGDNAVTGGGSGLTFNPLSFTPLPENQETGLAVEVANSLVYVVLEGGIYVYQTASTTPFSFSRSVNTFIGVGGVRSKTVISDGMRIFMEGSADNGVKGYYLIEGTNYLLLADEEADIPAYDLTRGPNLYQYRMNAHQFFGVTGQAVPLLQEELVSLETSRTYDVTESKLRGYPVWHARDYVTNDGSLAHDYPVVFYQAEGRQLMAFGYSEDTEETIICLVDHQSCLNDPSFFGVAQDVERVFEYSFPFIRNGSDPFTIRKVSLSFNNNIKEVELFQSTDGVSFVSLGEFDLSTITSNTAIWRRIGRFKTDVMFKIRFKPVSDSEPLVLIDGYFET